MIFQIGQCEGNICARCLGLSDLLSMSLRLLEPYDHVYFVLEHNEGTKATIRTSPTIGSGQYKMCRDYRMIELSVEFSIGHHDPQHTTLDNS